MMNCPDYLEGEARKFFNRNKRRLEQMSLLTEADFDSFCALCEIHGLRRTVYPPKDSREALSYNSLTKNYLALLKQFGMLPRDRKRSKLEPEDDIGSVIRKAIENTEGEEDE